MQTSTQKILDRREAGENVWLQRTARLELQIVPQGEYHYTVCESEAAVGLAMFNDLVSYAANKEGDLSVVLLGGRGAQAMYKIIRAKTEAGELDDLLGRLHVFTQDALAPMRMNNGFSFVRDFERLLGPQFFAKIKDFTPMMTEGDDLERSLNNYAAKLEAVGGIDIFFMGFGPEAEAASHLCYIKPGCGAEFDDFLGIIPISSSILEHHISKFKAGGSEISAADEEESRRANSILTLGPAAILRAKLIVQSIVDASTAPGKVPSFRRFLDTGLAEDRTELQDQCDANPGLLLRLHQNVRSYILPDLIA